MKMDSKNSGKSPMAFAIKRNKSGVTTPTRTSFLAKIAEESAKTDNTEPRQVDTEPPQVDTEPSHMDTEPPQVDIEDTFDERTIGRISPIPRKLSPVVVEIPEITRPESPHIPSIYSNIEEEKVNTITRDHLSPTKTNFVDIDDEDEIQERVTELINDPGKIDYNLEQEEVQHSCIETFKQKFQNLKVNYPDRAVEFPEGKSLNKIHDTYHGIIKSIYVNMNLGQLQLGYIIVLMAIEFVCVKAFNIPMAGFTKMELKRMHRYNQLMVELGENLYSTGGSQWPLEWRILSAMGMNVIIFIALKFLAQYVGGESMTEVIRNAVDKVLDNPVTKGDIESGNTSKASNSTSDGLGGMMDGMMGGMMGGDGGGMADIIAGLGTNFTQKMENSNKKEKKRKFVFDD